jgi:hypothetical protein
MATAAFVALGLGCSPGGPSPAEDRVAQAPAAGLDGRRAEGFAKAAPNDKAADEEQPRKIIYNASVELVVEDLDKAQGQLAGLVEDAKGYIAKSNTHGSPGSPRSGEWTLRVPAGRFREFIAGLAKLGEVRESKTDSDDITDRYYDLKAHIQNDQAEEEALRKLMVEKSADGKLEDLLAVRRELRDLRGKIDSQQGQMQRWDKEVAMATVVVNMQDRKDYVPTSAPSFGASISWTFEASVGALLAFGRGIVLVVVALAPWLAIFAPPALGLVWWARHRFKKAPGRPAASQPAAPPPVAS